MYARVEYSIGATPEQMLDALVKLFTDFTTDLATLPGIDSSNSQLIVTEPAGWTLFDDDSGPISKVIRAPDTQVPGQYKYAEIGFSSTIATLYGYGNFDAGTHTGTNKTGNPGNISSATLGQRWDSTQIGGFYLFASELFLCITGFYGQNWGDAYKNGTLLLAETTRDHPWHTDDIPAFCVVPTALMFYSLTDSGNSPWPAYKSAYFPELRDRNGATLLGVNASTYLGSDGVSPCDWIYSKSFPTGPTSRIPDGHGNEAIPMFPLVAVHALEFSIRIGILQGGFWMAPRALLAKTDLTVTQGGQEYVAIQASSTGPMHILFPRW